MSRVAQGARILLSDLNEFSRGVLKRPLRRYQLEPLEAILDSVVESRGLEFLLIFPRQSGKNEAVAQLLAFLLNVFQRSGGNIVYGAIGDALGLGIERLEVHLDNPLNRGTWTKRSKPTRHLLHKASVVFLSTYPLAAARGQTAHHLLVIDETQDQPAGHIEAVFTPMRAANNATALYIGTVKHTSDYLWQKKLELEREQQADGVQRVFLVDAAQVIAENPAYKLFLDAQVRKFGRLHPIVASEYFLEPIDASGGLFDHRRRALMRGDHPRQVQPQPGQIYVATLDVAGEDEAATDPIARLARPGRDYTVATIFQVLYPPPDTYAPGPTFQAVDVFVDHGSKHFQDHPGRPALVQRLLAWLQHWRIAHLICDESGVGLGITSWLVAALSPHRVTGYNFAGTGNKAQLGSMFLSLIETGRFKYWTDTPPVGAHGSLSRAVSRVPEGVREGSVPSSTSPHPVGAHGSLSRAVSRVPEGVREGSAPSPAVAHTGGLSDAAAEPRASGGSANGIREATHRGLSDAAWFWVQVRACTYEVPPDGRFDRDLRWEVPPTHRTDTPAGPQPTHDDRLISAALIAELDRRLRTGDLLLGAAESATIPPTDPLANLGEVY